MKEALFFLILGLGLGSIYAMLGSGLVIVYRGSGVINFAHGAMAMYGVFTFDEARRNGQIKLPWVDFLPTDWLNVPVTIRPRRRRGRVLVSPSSLAMAMGALIGLMCHFLVFRPLRNAAPLGKVIGSVGVLLYLQGVAQLNFGGTGRQPESVLPDEPVQNFLGLGRPCRATRCGRPASPSSSGSRLWALFRFTRFGLATRAAAGNEKGAVLLGYSPQFLAAVNWVIAAVLAVFAAIIVGPLQGSLTPIGLSALVVAALGAALIGGLRSIMVATIAGLAARRRAELAAVLVRPTDWFPEFFRNGVREVAAAARHRRGAVRARQEPAAARHRRGEATAAVARTGARPAARRRVGHRRHRGGVPVRGRRHAHRVRAGPHDVADRRDHHAVDGRRHRLRRADLAGPDVAGRCRRVLHGADDGRRLDDDAPTRSRSTVRGLPWPIAAALGVVAAVVGRRRSSGCRRCASAACSWPS